MLSASTSNSTCTLIVFAPIARLQATRFPVIWNRNMIEKHDNWNRGRWRQKERDVVCVTCGTKDLLTSNAE